MDQQVPDKQETVVEDLTVAAEEADEVKAGRIDYFLRLQGIDGDVSNSSYE